MFSQPFLANSKGDKNNFRPNNSFLPFEYMVRVFIKYASEQNQMHPVSNKLQLLIQVKEQSLFPLIKLTLEGNKYSTRLKSHGLLFLLTEFKIILPPTKSPDQ